MSLPLPGGNGLNCYNTIPSHEMDASVVGAAIKCQAEVAGVILRSTYSSTKAPARSGTAPRSRAVNARRECRQNDGVEANAAANVRSRVAGMPSAPYISVGLHRECQLPMSRRPGRPLRLWRTFPPLAVARFTLDPIRQESRWSLESQH